MEVTLKSGSTGSTAKIDSDGRLTVDSVSLPHITHEAIEDGSAFILSTGFISLTSTSIFNAIMYMKNTDSLNRHFHIQHFRVCGGNCAPASTMQVRVLKNASTGTIVSDAVDGFAVNTSTEWAADFGSTFYVSSGDGKTLTDGSHFTQFMGHAPGHSIQQYDGALIIGKNSTFSIEIKPSAAMTLCVELIGYFEAHD